MTGVAFEFFVTQHDRAIPFGFMSVLTVRNASSRVSNLQNVPRPSFETRPSGCSSG
jgi:hypothetical protein